MTFLGRDDLGILRDYTAEQIDQSASETVSTYVSASDPGAVGAGKMWLDTSGNLHVRDAANAAWIEIVSVD